VFYWCVQCTIWGDTPYTIGGDTLSP
jgi:hypothetical protein